ncbi:MAG: hypothetical protein AAGA56_23200, partial [Myxococcota bacterium]
RERALRRKQKLAEDGGSTQKDRNTKKREELLKRRRAAAEADDGEDLGTLTATEMVDDALARAGAKTVEAARKNWKTLQWVITGLVVVSVGIIAWRYQATTETQKSSDDLAKAVAAQQGFVLKPEEDKREEADKKRAYPLYFSSEEEKQQAALDRYAGVIQNHGDSSVATLAELGKAGIHLIKRDWDAAIAGYQKVIDSKLASEDSDVKGRALEGLGFAKEGKDDLDGAFQAFTSLGSNQDRMLAYTGRYHQARVHHARKEKQPAIDLLLKLREDLEKEGFEASKAQVGDSFEWLSQSVDDLLKRIDPSKLPPRAAPKLDPAMIQEMLKNNKGAGSALPLQLPPPGP